MALLSLNMFKGFSNTFGVYVLSYCKHTSSYCNKRGLPSDQRKLNPKRVEQPLEQAKREEATEERVLIDVTEEEAKSLRHCDVAS